MIDFSLFEITLFGFLYFSMGKKNVESIDEFPSNIYSSCGYDCMHHGTDERDRIINYVFEELFL